eukprot:GCRY01003851.1.p1 GENE.GCRY01003851.1~~GCRY01003851.1.p1  ORF type:complete len:364 (+),score=82.23 GCRY01003851.1:129-1220(+)
MSEKKVLYKEGWDDGKPTFSALNLDSVQEFRPTGPSPSAPAFVPQAQQQPQHSYVPVNQFTEEFSNFGLRNSMPNYSPNADYEQTYQGYPSYGNNSYNDLDQTTAFQEAQNNEMFDLIVNNGPPRQLEKLLEQGASPNALNKNNDSLLHVAARLNREHHLHVLLDHGADETMINLEGLTPLHLCARFGYANCIDVFLLMDNFRPNALGFTHASPLHFAVASQHLHCVTKLLVGGWDPNVRDEDGKTPLHLAVELKNAELVTTLIQCCDHLDLNVPDKDYQTALHIACLQNTPGIVKLLVEAGASLDIIDMYDCTPLDLCFEEGLIDIADYLISQGALVDEEKFADVPDFHPTGADNPTPPNSN